MKGRDFRFSDEARLKLFPIVMRSVPREGWPQATVVRTAGGFAYRNFLQVVGADPAREFYCEVGELEDSDPRVSLAMLEEVSMHCPLRRDEALKLKRDYELLARLSGWGRPELPVEGLIGEIWSAFEGGLICYKTALLLSVHLDPASQIEAAGVGAMEAPAEAVLKSWADPFFPGDVLNRLSVEPGRLKAIGCSSVREFVIKKAPFSYGRARCLMRLARAVPRNMRQDLTADHAEVLMRMAESSRRMLLKENRWWRAGCVFRCEI